MKLCFKYPIVEGTEAPNSLPAEREILQHQDGSHYICRWEVTDANVQAAINADPLVEMISETAFEAAKNGGEYGAR